MQDKLGEHNFNDFLILTEQRKMIQASVILTGTTHIIMEGFCFAGMIAGFSPLRCSTIQVPEYTAHKMGHEAKISRWRKKLYI